VQEQSEVGIALDLLVAHIQLERLVTGQETVLVAEDCLDLFAVHQIVDIAVSE